MGKLLKKLLLCTLLCSVVSIFLVIFNASCLANSTSLENTETIIIKFAHMNSIEDNVHKSALMIKENVEKRTDGKIKIEIFPSGQLGENKEVLEQARFGGKIMGQFGLGNLEEYVPNYSIFLYPFIFNDWAEAKKVLDSGLIAEWDKQLWDEVGIKMLAYGNFGVRDLYTVKKPVRTPEDTVGLKIRVQPVKMYIEMIKAMGAKPTPLPWMEVYSALAQGVIDGAEAPPRSIIDQKHYEVVKYLSITDHMLDVVPYATSRTVFESLDENMQKILLEETQKAVDWLTEETNKGHEANIKYLEEQGITIIRDVDKNAFREATSKIYEQFPEWTPGLYDEIQKILGR